MELFGKYELHKQITRGALETFEASASDTGGSYLVHRFPGRPDLWKTALKSVMKALAASGDDLADFGDIDDVAYLVTGDEPRWRMMGTWLREHAGVEVDSTPIVEERVVEGPTGQPPDERDGFLAFLESHGPVESAVAPPPVEKEQAGEFTMLFTAPKFEEAQPPPIPPPNVPEPPPATAPAAEQAGEFTMLFQSPRFDDEAKTAVPRAAEEPEIAPAAIRSSPVEEAPPLPEVPPLPEEPPPPEAPPLPEAPPSPPPPPTPRPPHEVGEFTMLFQEEPVSQPAMPPPAAAPPPAPPVAPPPLPSAAAPPSSMTPPRPPVEAAPAAPAPLPPEDRPGEFTMLFQSPKFGDEPTAGFEPPAMPPPPPPVASATPPLLPPKEAPPVRQEPSEFKLPFPLSKPSEPAPAQTSPQPPSSPPPLPPPLPPPAQPAAAAPQEAGEFTKQFQAPKFGDQPPQTSVRPSPPPPPQTPRPQAGQGEFTRMFAQGGTAQGPPPPPHAGPVPHGAQRTPGEFTMLFQAGAGGQPATRPPSGPASPGQQVGPPPPPAAPPKPAAGAGPGEFTRLFSAPKFGSTTGPKAPPTAAPGGTAQPGSFTAMFGATGPSTMPAPLPDRPASAKAASEYTLLFGSPQAGSAPGSTPVPPQNPPPPPTRGAQSSGATGLFDAPRDPGPGQGPVVLPSGPSEYTRMIQAQTGPAARQDPAPTDPGGFGGFPSTPTAPAPPSMPAAPSMQAPQAPSAPRGPAAPSMPAAPGIRAPATPQAGARPAVGAPPKQSPILYVILAVMGLTIIAMIAYLVLK